MALKKQSGIFPALLLVGILMLMAGSWILYAQEKHLILSSETVHEPAPSHPPDTTYVQQLIDNGNRLLKKWPDSAIAIYKRVYALSTQLHYARGRSVAYNNMSCAYKDKNEPAQALYYLQASMRIPYPNKRVAAISQYIDLFDLYYNAGNLQSIRALYPIAIALVDPKSKAEIRLLSRLNKYMAIVHLRSGSYDSAFHYYYRILSDLQTPDTTNSATFVETYNGMGAVSAMNEAYTQSLSYFNRALVIAMHYRDTNQVCMTLGNIVNIYVDQQDYKRGKRAGLQALELARKMKYYSYESLNARTMARIHYQEGAFKEALVYCKEAIKSALKVGQFDRWIAASYMTGDIYIKLGQYLEAEKYVRPAAELAMQRGKLDNIAEAYEQLSAIGAHTGRYKEAHAYMERYARMRDSLRGKESAERIARVELQYKTAAKDRQLAQQQLQLAQKENALREKNLWIIIVVGTGILLLALGVMKYYSRQRLQAVKLRNLAQQQEIERLNARMQGEEQERGRIAQELHDGVSVLLSAAKMNYTAIGKEHKELAETATYKEVMQLLNETGQEVRAISYNLVPELLIRQSLPAAIQAFCELMQKGHQLHIDLQIYGNYASVNVPFAYATYRMVQELLYNVAKHAQATNVLVQLMLQNDLLYITVEDNGIGFEAARSPAGMGLQNLRKRVESLHGHFSFTSQPDLGTAVEIEIPVS